MEWLHSNAAFSFSNSMTKALKKGPMVYMMGFSFSKELWNFLGISKEHGHGVSLFGYW